MILHRIPEDQSCQDIKDSLFDVSIEVLDQVRLANIKNAVVSTSADDMDA